VDLGLDAFDWGTGLLVLRLSGCSSNSWGTLVTMGKHGGLGLVKIFLRTIAAWEMVGDAAWEVVCWTRSLVFRSDEVALS
jgi:hypothetical protein